MTVLLQKWYVRARFTHLTIMHGLFVITTPNSMTVLLQKWYVRARITHLTITHGMHAHKCSCQLKPQFSHYFAGTWLSRSKKAYTLNTVSWY